MPCRELTFIGAALVQVMLAPVGFVTVHDMVPAGSGFVEMLPATRAVKVVVPPKVCGVEAESAMVGVRLLTPRVMELEVTVVKLLSPR